MTVEKLITDHIDIWSSALQTRSTAGRGSNGKIDLYGIKKLRELILELAVRGKLVPQDPSDEPASELLKRIAAEKAELVKQGKIKKQKPLPEISKDEKPFDLPKGWECARLGNTVAIIRGITFPASEKHKEPSEGKVPCLRTANVQDSIEWDDLLYVSESFVKRSEQFAEKGDIVMSMANSRELVGKVAYVNNIPTGYATFGGFLSVIRPYGFNAAFLMSVLRSPNIKSILIDSSSQTTNIANISLEKLNPLVISVPPISEQNRIASKVEELMSLCDQLEQQSLTSLEAHQQLIETLLATLADSPNAEELAENWARISQHFDTLFTTEASIDALKQTILQLAVMGKLVPQDPNNEPASELLKRIEQEKAQLVKEGKIKKQKPLPPVSDEEKTYVLPKGWEWCRLGDLALGSEAGWSPQCESHPRNGDDWGVLKISAVTWGEFNAEENKALPVTLEPKHEYEVKGNDFLLSRANTSELVARSVVVPQTVPKHLMLSDKIIRFQFSDLIDVKYINIVNNSMLSREYYEIVAGGTSASMKNVTRNQVSLLPVALPPYNEKKKIISATESVLVLIDTLKVLIVKSEDIKKNLTDSIVFNFKN
ncbi:restriction endonuclease subunit S [Lelliottia nimipressuralis]|uniref:restriction endonuclease subunit S n=1 Tax=Lelliottia nimipressuralis TaxID=69220 RepID=UPI00106BE06C|nr:restriction endonuclease subunit S [Lelliottia nimipressuralis]TFB22443.1 restriction endonuclease subunit S [Lelliottia nimipressuralis]